MPFVAIRHSCHAVAGHFRVLASLVIKLMQAWRESSQVSAQASRPAPYQLEAHRTLLLGRREVRSGITMLELVAELQSGMGASLLLPRCRAGCVATATDSRKNATSRRARSSRCPAGPRMMRQASGHGAAQGSSAPCAPLMPRGVQLAISATSLNPTRTLASSMPLDINQLELPNKSA